MNQKVDDKVEEKTPAQLRQEQRDKIVSVKSENDITKDDEEEKEDDENKDDEGDEGKEKEKEEKEDDKTKTKDDDNEEDDDGDNEEKKDDPEKLKKTIARLQKRIGTKTNTEKELAKQLADVQAKLKTIEDEKGEKLLTEEDVEARAKQIATSELAQKEFDAACGRLEEAGKAIDKTFPDKVTELGEDYGKIPFHMIEILDETERGGAVLNYLCDNPDEYETIRGMKPGRMAAKLKDISDKLKPKKEVKQISKVPPPNKPITPANNSNDTVVITGKETQEEFNRKREKQIAAKRQSRGY